MTTREACYLFKVSDGPEDHPREGDLAGTIRLERTPFISTEHRGESEGLEAPLDDGIFFFSLREGASTKEAHEIARFLNEHLLTIGTITRDADDISAEIENEHHNLDHSSAGVIRAVEDLKAVLNAGDIERAKQSVEAVEGWALRLTQECRGILEEFGS